MRVLGCQTQMRNESKGWGSPSRGGQRIPRNTIRRLAFVPMAQLPVDPQHTCWYPKDGELCLNRVKPGETLVEARSDSDVQIDRQIWV